MRAVQLTTALGIAGISLFILAHNRWAVLLGVVLWAVGVSLGFPLGTSAAGRSGPDPTARISVVSSVGYFANLAGPPVVGALAETAGLLNALWVIAALFLAAFAAAVSLRPVANPEPRQAPSRTDLRAVCLYSRTAAKRHAVYYIQPSPARHGNRPSRTGENARHYELVIARDPGGGGP